MKATLLTFLIILLFSILGLNALFHPGLYTAHDIWHQVARLYHYNQAVNEGIFPPYWISKMANGYGYPLFFFSYNLPWLLGLLFLKLGFDIPNTLKILFFIAFFASGVSMYLFSITVLKKRLPALVSSILYLWAPYHFLTVLVSASIGIVFTFIFLPLLLLGFYLSFKKESQNKAIILTSLSILGIALSHLITAFSLIPISLIFIIYLIIEQKKERQNGLKILFSGILLGIILSSFYLIPAVYYSKFTQTTIDPGFSTLYQHNFINFKQLVYSKWGYGPIVTDAKDGEISFQLGIAQWLALLSCVIILFKTKSHRNLIVAFLIAFASSTAMMLDVSKPIWDALSKLASFDYPTRFMLPVTFLGSFSAAIFLSSFKGKGLQIILAVILLSVALYTNRNHIRVNLYTDVPVSLYVASEQTTNTYNEYLPKDANSRLLSKPYQVTEGGDLTINNFYQNTQGMGFKFSSKKEDKISLGQFYFPGINTYLDNKKIHTEIDKQGRIVVPITNGDHSLDIKFEGTKLIAISKILSLVGLLGIVYLLFRKKLVFN